MTSALCTQPVRAANPQDRITRNASGDWMVDGEICRCSLGAHEGMARARATSLDLAALFDAATPAERERLLTAARAGFNSIEELWHRAAHNLARPQ